MNNLKISLVIPAYNVERYIAKCLKSCLKQDLRIDDYEIIVVNDGSKDNTLAIAKETLKNISNSRIISQENMGLSEARNKGLMEACGEYVWFIDSDDYIYENCIKFICEKAVGNDVLCLSYTRVYENNDFKQNFVVNIGSSKTGQDFLSNGDVWHPAQLYVYKRQFLIENNLSFFPGIYHEDTEFTPRMLYYANKISSLKGPVYYFLRRSNSITTTVNPKRSRDLIVVANSLNQFSSQIVNKKVALFFYNTISLVLNNALHELKYQDLKDINVFKQLIIDNKYLFKNMIKSNILKYKIEGFLLCILPSKVIDIYNLLSRYKLLRRYKG